MGILKVRRETFETNSSSSHSIVLMNEKDEHIVLPEEFRQTEVIDLTGYDLNYTWGPKVLTTFEEKLGYAVASSKSNLTELIRRLNLYLFPNLEGFKVKWNDCEEPDMKDKVVSEDWELFDSDTVSIDYRSREVFWDAVGTLGLSDYLLNPNVCVLVQSDDEELTRDYVAKGAKVISNPDMYW